jgi:hypothetical protein
MPTICYSPAAGANLILRTRDEHCDPHIHAFNKSGNWELRVFFSYADNDLVHNSFDILTGMPMQSQINSVIQSMNAHIDKCRAEWWSAVSSVCLGNKYVTVPASGVLTKQANAGVGIFLIDTAKYLAATKTVEFTVSGSNAIQSGVCP